MQAAKRHLHRACQTVLVDLASSLPINAPAKAGQSQHVASCALRSMAWTRHVAACQRTQLSQGHQQPAHLRWCSAAYLKSRIGRVQERCTPSTSSLATYSTSSPALRSAFNAKAQASSTRFRPVTLSNLRPFSRKDRKRRARGGGDKQAGRGHKGQKSRSGTGKPALFFEGGQTPFWKMLPKRGFKNRFRSVYDNVLLAEVEAAVRCGRLDPSRVITVKHLYDAGLLEKKAHSRDGVQILAKQPSPWKRSRLQARGVKLPPEFSIPVDLEVQRVSEPARVQIEAAGGRVRRVYYNKLGMRAVLLPLWFAKKGRLVPRAVQMVPYKKQWRFDSVGTIPAKDEPALEDVPPPEKQALRATG